MNFSKTILLSVFVTLFFSCNENNTQDESILDKEKSLILKDDSHESCGFINNDWGQNAYYSNIIVDQYQTNFIKYHHTRISNLFGIQEVPLYFAKDDFGKSENAVSYFGGYIIYGEDFYLKALNYGQAAPIMIQAHEVAHQIQIMNPSLPSRKENTGRARELEADAFSGYYFRRPNGYNADWSIASGSYNFVASIGDFDFNDAGHHGTPAQRRSAFRLGWLLGESSLSITNLDYYFFYYYDQLVITGNLKKKFKKPQNIDAEVHEFILSKLSELKDIQTGKISEEEFTKLN